MRGKRDLTVMWVHFGLDVNQLNKVCVFKQKS